MRIGRWSKKEDTVNTCRQGTDVKAGRCPAGWSEPGVSHGQRGPLWPTHLAQHVQQVGIGHVHVPGGQQRVVAQPQRGQQLGCRGIDAKESRQIEGGGWHAACQLMHCAMQSAGRSVWQQQAAQLFRQSWLHLVMPLAHSHRCRPPGRPPAPRPR